MSLYTKARRHIDMVDVKKRHKIKEEKIKKQKIIEEENRKKSEYKKKLISPYLSDWRSTLTESEWYAISGSGPTNGTTQTFAFGDPDSGLETRVSGIGGLEQLPPSVTIDGEVYDAPTYNQLAIQGYAPLMQMQRRTDLQDVNSYLDASQQFTQKIGADYMMGARVTSIEPQKPYMDAYFEVKGKWDKIIDELQYELQTKYAGQMAPKDLVDKINSLIVQRDAELDALSKKYASVEPEASQVAGPYDAILDKVADVFEVGTAKNFLDYYINNFVVGGGNQNQNLTGLLSKNDYQFLQRMLSASLTGKYADDPQGTLDGIMQSAPAGIKHSLGNNTKMDLQYYKKTGDFKITKDYVFTGPEDFGGRGDDNLQSRILGVGSGSYVRIAAYKAGVSINKLIQNPMRFHVIIKNKKKRQNESTTWERIQKYRYTYNLSSMRTNLV